MQKLIAGLPEYPRISHIRQHAANSVVLLIGGGISGRRWKRLRRKIKPDYIIGINGVIGVIPDVLDVWVCCDNRAHKMPWFNTPTSALRFISAKIVRHAINPRRAIPIIQNIDWFNLDNADIRLIEKPHGQYDIEPLNTGALSIRVPRNTNTFSVKHSGLTAGLIITKRGNAGKLKPRSVGTTMLQALHVCGILGCAQVHTIGFDLCVRNKTHWYESPSEAWHDSMYLNHYGCATTWLWLETAALWEALRPLWAMQHLDWFDHSDGLLQARGNISVNPSFTGKPWNWWPK